jgi:hypothetical protein
MLLAAGDKNTFILNVADPASGGFLGPQGGDDQQKAQGQKIFTWYSSHDIHLIGIIDDGLKKLRDCT